MASWFWLALLLTRLSLTESVTQAENCIFQRPTPIWKKTGHDANLTCKVKENCFTSDLDFQWFIFKEDSHFLLSNKHDPRFTFSGSSLIIKSTNANDSGIYHCAALERGGAKSGAQYVGTGSILVVKDNITPVSYILLWVLLALMLVYSLAVVTLIILKKGCKFDTSKPGGKKNSTRKMAFREVLQEMYSRKTVRSNSNQRHVEVPTSHCNTSVDNTYENI
ncbi:uncharacterized protein si:ch211-139g16.8 isoform X2 [Synchiropus splendidus]|uniref:uncharacterized protein si:ch211-139g16.8 isoform X2 n=1 Tax=Synchiropus splendidus TaxID=270530 RepID=UPI00237E76BB|nr:uncharacterized protein si:ch211-139g16.8 isoform X2 [Synchiropus splendidus]